MFKRLITLIALLGATNAFAQSSGYGTCTGTVEVQTTSTEVIPNGDVPGGRNLMMVQNTGTNPMYCSMGSDAEVNEGFLLPAGGGTWYLTSIEGSNGVFIKLPIEAVNCIADGGTTQAVWCDY